MELNKQDIAFAGLISGIGMMGLMSQASRALGIEQNGGPAISAVFLLLLATGAAMLYADKETYA